MLVKGTIFRLEDKLWVSNVQQDFPGSARGKESACQRVQSLGWKKEVASHSSILAWKIPWTEEPGRLQFMRPQTAGHGSARTIYNRAITLNKSSIYSKFGKKADV